MKKIVILVSLMISLSACSSGNTRSNDLSITSPTKENPTTTVSSTITPTPLSTSTMNSENKVSESKPTQEKLDTATNIIDKNKIAVGDTICGLKVVSVDKKNGSINDVKFTGNIQLTVDYQWSDEVDGEGYVLTVDKTDIDKMPRFLDDNNIVVKNSKARELLKSDIGKATVVLNNYSVGERQIITSAELVNVIKNQPAN